MLYSQPGESLGGKDRSWFRGGEGGGGVTIHRTGVLYSQPGESSRGGCGITNRKTCNWINCWWNAGEREYIFLMKRYLCQNGLILENKDL